MLERILGWFETRPTDEAATVVATERAVCVLLIAAARADGQFAGDEAREIARLVGAHFDLSPADTAELVAIAAGDEPQELFPVTRLLTQRLGRDERRSVLSLLWRVVFSDGRLEAREDALMHRIAHLLDIPHHELIATKLAARKDLSGS
ncbi:MAG TPA: TerB family tellurite resistance protein [Candidatus Krumholzibacteria bacterium]|nr:TerB family tellurite resistance protein [Candidatus Krumholzibacteria bacterium]HPD72184.1 TerB family tellurite resistance protein [Candidatus Krumholzibacteria bacterium]HRY40884.1 TerB family tellurite resistance protein [Candidatus Krumholzibacteria bacterium]